MERYTKKWALQYLREHKDIRAIAQDCDGFVWVYEKKPECYHFAWDVDDNSECYFYDKILEYKDGWQNSLVTREDL